jgi:hypothetical protein
MMGRIGRIIRPQTYIYSEPTPPRSSPELLRARRYAPTALLRLLVRKTSKKVIEGVPQMACCSLAVAEGGIVVHKQIRHGQQNRVRANYESEYQWPHMISSACCGRATAGVEASDVLVQFARDEKLLRQRLLQRRQILRNALSVVVGTGIKKLRLTKNRSGVLINQRSRARSGQLGTVR